MSFARSKPLTRWDRLGLLVVLLAMVVLGGVVIRRSALSVWRHGDYAVYTHAAWTVRAGGDLRSMTCMRGWHYTYPPTLAVLMVPLAEKPTERTDVVALPVVASVAIWYAISVVCLALALHIPAKALEQTLAGANSHQPPGRAWWRLRIFPALACAPVVGETFTRGQVNLILLALISGFIGALVCGRAFRGGVLLAGAMCLKVVPAFLLLAPFCRRDLRCLAGCAAGLIVIGLLIPMLGLGLQGTIDDYCKYGQLVLGPGLGVSKDERLHADLTSITCGHSQSPMAVIHSWMHPEKASRPDEIPASTRAIHWLLGSGLTLLTLLAGRDLFRSRTLDRKHSPSERREMPAPLRLTLLLSLLTINMLLLSPMCHSHYLCLAIPTFTALMAWDYLGRSDDGTSWPLIGLMGLFLVANIVPMLPGMVLLDDGGMAGIALIVVLLAGTRTLGRTRPLAASSADLDQTGINPR